MHSLYLPTIQQISEKSYFHTQLSSLLSSPQLTYVWDPQP
jgi:hypothetical protein